MPSKTRTEPVIYNGKIDYYENQDNTYYPESHTPITINYGDNSVSLGGGIPGWRRVIAEGGNATTPMSGTKTEFVHNEASLHYGIQLKPHLGGTPTYGYRDIQASGPYIRVSGKDPSQDPDGVIRADNQARKNFYSKLAAVESTFKGQVLTGELKEVLHSIRHPGQALRNGISGYLDYIKRYGQRKSKFERPKFIRDTWLEYSFGWRPLIADLEEGILAFYTSKWPKPIFQMVRATGKDNHVETSNPGYINLGYGFHLKWMHNYTWEHGVRYYGVYRSVGNGRSDPRVYGFSPWEFVPTLWELIPYSFLVDYFTNIGDIISSWSYRFMGPDWVARGGRSAVTSITTSEEFYYFADYYNAADYTHWMSGNPGSSRVTKSAIQRGSVGSVPLPSLQLEVPGMTSVKWINLAALTKQLDSTRLSLR